MPVPVDVQLTAVLIVYIHIEFSRFQLKCT